MNGRLILIVICLAMFAGSFALRDRYCREPDEVHTSPQNCRRIISLAPSLTQILCDLKLEDRIVGVSRYCLMNHIPQVAGKPQVGGFLDPNLETILRLKPDLVLILTEHEKAMPGLRQLGLHTLAVCHQNVKGCIESIRAIGAACGEEALGNCLAGDMQARLDRVRRKTAGCPRPRVLFCIERTMIPGRLADVYIAGRDDYYSEMIDCAGGQNAYARGTVRYPTVSPEVILHLDPEVVVDLVDGLNQREATSAGTLADWLQLAGVAAVKQRRVYAFDKSATVPGTKIAETIEELARILHPEISWDEP
ncbi:MAG: ABC transporter substrate-binding protein [Pirellulales bacterium]|nr:ABC transporter substrate-binding protein [Pirellulales bacterium]